MPNPYLLDGSLVVVDGLLHLLLGILPERRRDLQVQALDDHLDRAAARRRLGDHLPPRRLPRLPDGHGGDRSAGARAQPAGQHTGWGDHGRQCCAQHIAL